MRHVFTNREEAERCGAPLLKTFFFSFFFFVKTA
jgi:hypothetical protein